MSFVVWKISSEAMRMKIQFRDIMQKNELNTSKEILSIKSDFTQNLERVSLLALRLATLFLKNEKSRLDMRNTITNYKSNILVERRAQIRMTELELDRLTSDMELMERERLTNIDEIEGAGGLESQVTDIEEQMREHSNSSTVMQNGRINVAHSKKKKRLDNDLERLLELIEQKKTQCASLEERCIAIEQRKSEKEIVLIDLEKELVQVLIEQQKLVLNIVEDGKNIEDKARILLRTFHFPWPPLEEPSQDDAKNLVADLVSGRLEFAANKK